MNNIHKYLKNLGFSDFTVLENSNFGEEYNYIVNLSDTVEKNIPFLFCNDDDLLYKFHLQEWNKNKLDYFIAVTDSQSYIFNAKEKPTNNEGLFKTNNAIESFSYGISTIGYEDVLSLPIHKENIDNSFFFNFVIDKQKEVKNEIDEYLLNNLLALREKLLEFDNNKTNVNNIILKSLFVKYLEDRNILNNTSIVETFNNGVNSVLEIFDSIKVINGDILKKDLDLKQEHISELNIFFTHDYITKQKLFFSLFQFDKIPTELISNVYESFLGQTDTETKQGNGVFYTRTFVVDFMLSQKIYKRIIEQPYVTILDPACGSGIFLVQSLKKILNENKNKTIEEKSILLKNQIFGVDIDINALQITAFSLYLTLLDSCSIDEIKEQLRIKNPILPSLIGENLINKNTISDEVKFEFDGKVFKTFDCIVANPPWSQLKIPKDESDFKSEILKSRAAIEKLSFYKNVSKLQTSQAFLLKISEFCNSNSDIAIIVNNSNFLNEQADDFRVELLQKYRLNTFFELSNVSSILFKGTEHPCAVLIMNKSLNENNEICYITPRLTQFSKKLRIISYTSKDEKKAKQSDFINEDLLWKVFVNGNWKDYQLIKKIEINNSIFSSLFCQRGFQFKKNKITSLKPKYVAYYNINYNNKYFITKKDKIDWNNQFFRFPLPLYITKEIHNGISNDESKLLKNYYILKTNYNLKNSKISIEKRLEIDKILQKNNQSLYSGERIIIERTPKNKNKLNAVFTDEFIVCKDNTLILKSEKYIKTILGIINSKICSFYLSNNSSHFSKGNVSVLDPDNFTNFPFPNFENNKEKCFQIESKIDQITVLQEKDVSFTLIENELDELVFDLYGLLEFEKEMIREFYQINVDRKNDSVKTKDIENYIDTFRNSYQLILKENLRLNVEAIVSSNIGTIVKFQIVDVANYKVELIKKDNINEILILVKKKQIEVALLRGSLFEEKVKLYDDNCFYIIKSNYFKDWTKRQAIEDAKEEFNEMINKLK